jgi:hypothetical protein
VIVGNGRCIIIIGDDKVGLWDRRDVLRLRYFNLPMNVVGLGFLG